MVAKKVFSNKAQEVFCPHTAQIILHASLQLPMEGSRYKYLQITP